MEETETAATPRWTEYEEVKGFPTDLLLILGFLVDAEILTEWFFRVDKEWSESMECGDAYYEELDYRTYYLLVTVEVEGNEVAVDQEKLERQYDEWIEGEEQEEIPEEFHLYDMFDWSIESEDGGSLVLLSDSWVMELFDYCGDSLHQESSSAGTFMPPPDDDEPLVFVFPDISGADEWDGFFARADITVDRERGFDEGEEMAYTASFMKMPWSDLGATYRSIREINARKGRWGGAAKDTRTKDLAPTGVVDPRDQTIEEWADAFDKATPRFGTSGLR